MENILDLNPKEIILKALEELALILNNYGFKFSKNKKEFTKKTDHFVFTILFQANRHNSQPARTAEVWIHCGVKMKDGNSVWGGTLSHTDAKEFQGREWNFYDYETSLNEIKFLIEQYFIPFTEKFIESPENLAIEASQKGFHVFGETYQYNINWSVPIHFFIKYGGTQALQNAIQTYYDRSEPAFMKLNFKKHIEALKNNLPSTYVGSFPAVEAVLQYDLNIKYE